MPAFLPCDASLALLHAPDNSQSQMPRRHQARDVQSQTATKVIRYGEGTMATRIDQDVGYLSRDGKTRTMGEFTCIWPNLGGSSARCRRSRVQQSLGIFRVRSPMRWIDSRWFQSRLCTTHLAASSPLRLTRSWRLQDCRRAMSFAERCCRGSVEM